MTFKELEIRDEVRRVIEERGYEKPTEIQFQAITVANTGRDVLGQAQTGTGKTASFLIPILNTITTDREIQALIIAPTRELAIQIKEEVKAFAKYLDITAVAVYGGDPIDKQMKLLRDKPQIVVGTPGRIIDLNKRGKLKLHDIKYFVLDEVDEMLSMGFIDDIDLISSKMPKDKQTLLFSATLPKEIKRITEKYLDDPKHIKVDAKSLTVDLVDQSFIISKASSKLSVLHDILLLNGDSKVIIFVQTKRMCDEVHEFLTENKFKTAKIHGDITQSNRTATINHFRASKYKVLVATDVVARGIDINDVGLVVNLQLPQDMEYYIHRIGRTGRAGSKGRAITLVSDNEYRREFKHYSRRLKCDITETKAPQHQDVVKMLMERYFENIQGSINPEKIEAQYLELATLLLKDTNETVLTSHLLKLLYPELGKEKPQTPVRSKRDGDRGGDRSRNGNRSGGDRSKGSNRSSDRPRRRESRD